jgi:iron complex transport system substrate-binding protein
VAPAYATDYKSLRSISTSSKVAREVLIAEQPDLVIDNQPDYFYNPAEGFATREELAQAGAKTYTLEAKCGGGKKDATIQDVYTDLRNFGALFGVSDRAEGLITDMQRRIDTVQAAVKDKPGVRVMFYDAGESPLGVFGPGAWDYALKLAGGTNVFGDAKESYLQLSVEEIAARDSDVIIVAGYTAEGVKSSEARVAFIRQTFPNHSAVKNNRVVIIPYEYTNPGLQNVLGVEAFAKAFHPDAFK